MARVSSGLSRLPVFCAATDGNHGRAVAWMARHLGAQSVIFVPANTLPSQIAAIQGEGAEVRIGTGTYDDAVRQCAEDSQRNGWQVIADTGYPGYLAIPRWIMDGYRTLFEEYEEQRSELDLREPNLVLIQAGVGGLLCAALEHFRTRGNEPRIACIEPDDAACLFESITSADGQPRTGKGSQNSIMDCLNCGEVSLAAWPTVRRGTDLFVTIEDTLAEEAVERFAHPASGDPVIRCGPSGAAGLAGLLALWRDGRCRPSDRVFLINTEGPQFG